MFIPLEPTSRLLQIETDAERIERYVHTAYGRLEESTRPATDVAVLLTEPTPATVTFNGVPVVREWSGPGLNPWLSGAYIVDQFVWRALAQDRDWMALYACAVVVGTRAALLVGKSGVGKTTLGLALQRLGARVIGDEMIVIDRRDFAVAAVSRRLSIRWGAENPLGDTSLDALLQKHASVVGTGDGRFLAVDRRVFGEVPPPAKLAATFVVTRGGQDPGVRPSSAARSAAAIAQYLGARPKDLAQVAELGNILSSGRCFTLSLGDPNASARVVLEALNQC